LLPELEVVYLLRITFVKYFKIELKRGKIARSRVGCKVAGIICRFARQAAGSAAKPEKRDEVHASLLNPKSVCCSTCAVVGFLDSTNCPITSGADNLFFSFLN
jgi:hypothetical protein